MKKLTFVLLSIAVLAASFTSCKKDTTNVAPVVTFANIADSALSVVATADPYTLGITVTSDAGLSKVVIKETKAGTTSTKATVTDFTDKLKYENQYAVAGIPSTGITVTIEATDKNDLVTSREILVTKQSTAVALTDVPVAKTIGGGGSTNGGYIDLDGGNVYKKTEVNASATVKATIDILFGGGNLANNDLALPAASQIFAAGTGTNLGETTLDATSFGTATSSTLTGLLANKNSVAVSQGKVFYFETATHKGLILINTFVTGIGTDNIDITISIKSTSK